MKQLSSILLNITLMLVAAMVQAQKPAKVSRIGLLNTNVSSAFTARTEGFRQGLNLGISRAKTF